MFPGVADWELLRGAAIHLERPILLAIVGGSALLLALRSVLLGPHRFGVAAGVRRRRTARLPDPSWILSSALRRGALTLFGVALAGPVGLVRETRNGNSYWVLGLE